jgi:hypothetical protein
VQELKESNIVAGEEGGWCELGWETVENSKCGYMIQQTLPIQIQRPLHFCYELYWRKKLPIPLVPLLDTTELEAHMLVQRICARRDRFIGRSYTVDRVDVAQVEVRCFRRAM